MAAAEDGSTPRQYRSEHVDLAISVDFTGILPDGLPECRNDNVIINWEQIYILSITSASQLELLEVDFVKKAIQVICWECFKIGLLKRNFKMWLQTAPYNTTEFPYGQFSAINYDMTWKEVLDNHRIPHDHRHIHLRALPSDNAQE